MSSKEISRETENESVLVQVKEHVRHEFYPTVDVAKNTLEQKGSTVSVQHYVYENSCYPTDSQTETL